jgi:hypothetical protein
LRALTFASGSPPPETDPDAFRSSILLDRAFLSN